VKNIWLFEGKLALGTAAMIGSGLLVYARGRRRSGGILPQRAPADLLDSVEPA
jgi:hypothetical protein